jgi:uncharacterized protein YukE
MSPNVSVATEALRKEAGVWEQQADTLQTLTGRVEGLRMTGLESGMFYLILDAYTQVVDVVSGRCGEGAQRTSEIATTLRHVADTYDEEEQRNLHRMTGLY